MCPVNLSSVSFVDALRVLREVVSKPHLFQLALRQHGTRIWQVALGDLYQAIWNTSVDFYHQFGRCPSRQELELCSISKNSASPTPLDQNALTQSISHLYAVSPVNGDQWVIDTLQTLIDKLYVEPAIDAAALGSTRPRITQYLRLLKDLFYATRVSPVFRLGPRSPTGMPDVDSVLGGGVASGELVVVLGKSGSGKSLFALNLAHAMSRGGVRDGREDVVLYVSFQHRTRDWQLQHLQVVTGFPYQLFDARLFARIPAWVGPAYVDRLKEEQVGFRYQVLEPGICSYDSVADAVELISVAASRLKDQGKGLRAVFVDSATYLAHFARDDASELAERLKEIPRLLKRTASELETCVFITHNLSGECSLRKASVTPSARDADEVSDFAEAADASLILWPVDDTSETRVRLIGRRPAIGSVPHEVRVTLNHNTQQIVMSDGQLASGTTSNWWMNRYNRTSPGVPSEVC